MYFWSTISNLYIRYINVYKLVDIFFAIYFVFHWYGKELVFNLWRWNLWFLVLTYIVMFFLPYFYLFNIKDTILVPTLELVLQIFGVFCAKTFIRRRELNLIKQLQEKCLLKLGLDEGQVFKLNERRKLLISKPLWTNENSHSWKKDKIYKKRKNGCDSKQQRLSLNF